MSKPRKPSLVRSLLVGGVACCAVAAVTYVIVDSQTSRFSNGHPRMGFGLVFIPLTVGAIAGVVALVADVGWQWWRWRRDRPPLDHAVSSLRPPSLMRTVLIGVVVFGAVAYITFDVTLRLWPTLVDGHKHMALGHAICGIGAGSIAGIIAMIADYRRQRRPSFQRT